MLRKAISLLAIAALSAPAVFGQAKKKAPAKPAAAAKPAVAAPAAVAKTEEPTKQKGIALLALFVCHSEGAFVATEESLLSW